jgi:hypothetical protein
MMDIYTNCTAVVGNDERHADMALFENKLWCIEGELCGKFYLA